MTRIWPMRVLHLFSHHDWFKGDHVTQPEPIKGDKYQTRDFEHF